MEKITGLLAAVSTAFVSTVSFADGMPATRGVRVADTAPVAQVNQCSAAAWQGLYAGANIGSGNYSSQISMDSLLGINTRHDDNNGLLVGGQIGYNFARCNSVMGIEADFAWSNTESNWGLNLGGFGGPSLFNAKSELNWLSTIRTRGGVTVDNMFLYLTGGVAFADIQHSGSSAGLILPSTAFSDSDTRWGWVVGAGLEYKLTDMISVKSEGLYTKFEDRTFNYNPLQAFVPGTGLNLRAHDDLWTLRMGVNFKIGDRDRGTDYAPMK